MFKHPRCEPILFRALSRHPRSTRILQALLDAGYYHDQMIVARVGPDESHEEEKVSLLLWALLQPQKRISSAVIELLIGKKAKLDPGKREPAPTTTPLMVAIQTRRPDLVESLIRANAKVAICDRMGNTPLSLATRIGGDLGIAMMGTVLAADPPKDDGSLHDAARDLNAAAMQLLVESGHNPNFPSDRHGHRSALAELCLTAADSDAGLGGGEWAMEMEKAMAYLIAVAQDLTILSHGKSALLLAMESRDPHPDHARPPQSGYVEAHQRALQLLHPGPVHLLAHRVRVRGPARHPLTPRGS